jgi:hypothetical protein
MCSPRVATRHGLYHHPSFEDRVFARVPRSNFPSEVFVRTSRYEESPVFWIDPNTRIVDFSGVYADFR